MKAISETEIRARLRAETEVIKGSRNRLADLWAAIPISPQETSEEDLCGSFDLATEVRTVLAILLQESFKPLLKSLRATADYQPAAAAPNTTPEVLRLDLTAAEERMRGLQVWKVRGRWFAWWLKPDAPEDAPEDERWEFLHVEEDEKQPGILIYREL